MTRRHIAFAAVAALCVACGNNPSAPTPPPTVPARSNHAPTASVVLSPPGAIITGATVVTFTSAASDPDGDAASLSWQFGAGEAGEGATVSHTFYDEGPHTVVLSASDTHGETTKVTTNVAVKGLTGDWLDIGGKVGFTFEQHGSSLDGTKNSVRDGNAALH